jgi:hypothetical protein
MVADLDVFDALADCFDDAGRLMSVNGGKRAAPCAFGEGNVGMADGAGFDVDENFAGSRLLQLDFFDDEGSAELAANSGFDHDFSGIWAIGDEFRGISFRAGARAKTNAACFVEKQRWIVSSEFGLELGCPNCAPAPQVRQCSVTQTAPAGAFLQLPRSHR